MEKRAHQLHAVRQEMRHPIFDGHAVAIVLDGLNVPAASHDDTLLEHVEQAAAEGLDPRLRANFVRVAMLDPLPVPRHVSRRPPYCLMHGVQTGGNPE